MSTVDFICSFGKFRFYIFILSRPSDANDVVVSVQVRRRRRRSPLESRPGEFLNYQLEAAYPVEDEQ